MAGVSDQATMSATAARAKEIAATIRQASRHTGVSFDYLMAQARRESALEPGAGSRVSSAAGLFQFTRQTWLQVIKLHGASVGLGELADAIHRTASGAYEPDDPEIGRQILDLRRDPDIAAVMAGQYARDNKAWLEKTLGRPVDATDLYLAHFLGPGGAARVLAAHSTDPDQPAAPLLPEAARTNPGEFYGPNHAARSVAALYDRVHRAFASAAHRTARAEPAVAAPLAESSAPKSIESISTPAAAQSETRLAAFAAELVARIPADSDVGQVAADVAPTDDSADAGSSIIRASLDAPESADSIVAPMPGLGDSRAAPRERSLRELVAQFVRTLSG